MFQQTICSPEHENYPVDNIKTSKKDRKENKEKQIHSCSANFILEWKYKQL